MLRFVIIVNGFQPLTIITKCSILDVAAALDPPLVSVGEVVNKMSNHTRKIKSHTPQINSIKISKRNFFVFLQNIEKHFKEACESLVAFSLLTG